MSGIEANSNTFDEEQDGQGFTIQPYQFEPRINSDAADTDNESRSGDEDMEGSEEENTDPRQENSDWYVAMVAIDQFIVLLQLVTDSVMSNKVNLTQLCHVRFFLVSRNCEQTEHHLFMLFRCCVLTTCNLTSTVTQLT